jgi:hypothetical protein
LSTKVRRNSKRASANNHPKHFKDFEMPMKCSGKRGFHEAQEHQLMEFAGAEEEEEEVLEE